MKWIRVPGSRHLESEPRCFFIRRSKGRGQRKIRLCEYDGSPNGYHVAAYCVGVREAKRIAELITRERHEALEFGQASIKENHGSQEKS